MYVFALRELYFNLLTTTANQSVAKNVAETAFHNFSTRGTTFRVGLSMISQPSSSFVFSLPISPCARFLPSLPALHLLYEDDWGRISLLCYTARATVEALVSGHALGTR